jgi:UDP-glucose 4-epimerase
MQRVAATHLSRGTADALVIRPATLARVAPSYRDRSVLVTGGASFIGSHLVEALVSIGARVTVVDDFSTGSMDNLHSVTSRIRVVRGDLRDHDVARTTCADSEIVFHLAAAHGGRGYIDTHPIECLNNMTLDHVVFDAASRAGAAKIVYASSACVYPTTLQERDTDRHLLRESDAGFDRPGKAFADGEYGWYKLMGELQLRTFVRERGVDGIACRIFSAYGERENDTHAVIALIERALAREDPYPIWGNGSQTRNFTYVGDTVAGLLLSGAMLRGFEVVNVGTAEHVTISQLVRTIFDHLGWAPSQIDLQLDRPVGVRSRAADLTRSRTVLGWEPEYGLEEGITRTVEWCAAVRRAAAAAAAPSHALLPR